TSPPTSAASSAAPPRGPTWNRSSGRFARSANDQPRCQRQDPGARRRPGDAAPLRAARSPAAERSQVRLRPRPVRRVHRAGRWTGGVLVRDAGLDPRRAAHHHARGAGYAREARPRAARLHRRAGGAVRLLHPRDDDAGAGAARAYAPSHERRDPQAHERKSLPLRHPHADPARGRARCARSMNPRGVQSLNRRGFIARSGALVVSFSLLPRLAGAQAGKLPGSLSKEPMLDAWIRVGADGRITVFTGKAELGQGIKTALVQVAAEELVVEPSRIELVTADTGRTPDEQYTSGSQSMQESGTAILHAAAQTRAALAALAAKRLGVPLEQLTIREGAVNGVAYGELVAGQALHVRAQPQSPLRDPMTRTVMGKPLARVDIPAKLTGQPIYVQDLRLPGMVHARVLRPPSYGARLKALDSAAAAAMPGVLKVVRDGSFVALVAEREYQAVTAARALAAAAQWDERVNLPESKEIYQKIATLPSENTVIHENGKSGAGAAMMEAEYRRPYQMHASIGPSCAVALYRDEALTVWTHGQGVYPLRGAIAEMTGLPAERVRCIHMEGAGCYGHNGADDAAADAALLARALPGRAVRVQWMREDEHGWEPYGPAMLSKVRGRVSADGAVEDFQYEVWSNTHSTRPGPAGSLAAAWQVEKPFAPPPPRPIPQPAGGGDRNAIPLYKFANSRVVHHFVTEMPLRVSALRGLGAYMN